MLQANATKGPSRIHGLGLFACELIHKGDVVWSADRRFDVFLTEEQMMDLPLVARNFCETYSFFDPVHKLYIISTDDDRYTNDSEDPNTRYDTAKCSTFALRDIEPGEEITVDYYELEATYPPWRSPVYV